MCSTFAGTITLISNILEIFSFRDLNLLFFDHKATRSQQKFRTFVWCEVHNPMLKHVGYLETVLMRQEWSLYAFFVWIFLDKFCWKSGFFGWFTSSEMCLQMPSKTTTTSKEFFLPRAFRAMYCCMPTVWLKDMPCLTCLMWWSSMSFHHSCIAIGKRVDNISL